MSFSAVVSSSSSSLLFPTATEEEQIREESDASEAQNKWSELPKDLVVTIGERLNVETDYIKFRCTCKSWYSFLSKKPYHPTHQFPLLILRYIEERSNCFVPCVPYGIFGLANNKLYHLRDLPDHLQIRKLLGSSHGWLIFELSNDDSISIYNPFTKAQLRLPPIGPQEGRWQAQKVILSSTPAAVATTTTSVAVDGVAQFSHFVVAVATSNRKPWNQRLVYCRSGDKEWIDFGPKCDDDFEDVLIRGNKIYALQGICTVYVFHMDADMQINSSYSIFEPQLELRDEISSAYFGTSIYFCQPYLVESSDDLLVVVRVIERKRLPIPEPPIPGFISIGAKESHHNTICFMVFKWEGERLLHVNSIGDQSLFLGLVSSFSISSRDFPDCRGNCIYFTDGYRCYHDKDKRNYTKGVFSLEDKCIVSSLPLQGCAGSGHPWKLRFHNPPAWLTYIP